MMTVNQVDVLRNVLFEELEVGVRSTTNLVRKVKSGDWDYRPRENMRTLRELVHHLVMIPEIDLAILRESPEKEVQQIEGRDLPDAEAMCETMKDGCDHLKDYFMTLSDEDYLTKETRPFYLDKGSTQAKWLTEIVTHTFHHRAQLFNYMKQLGYDINMFDLYV
jgi:uncharacterized damage-inducible protein DinB